MEYLEPMMELKDNLALRLRALMDRRPDLDTQSKIHKKTGLSQSSVQRVLAREVHTGLDVLQLLADAFGVNPLDLIKALDSADDAESISPNYDEERLIKAWRKLSDEDKHRAMAFITVSGLTRIKHNDGAKQIDIDQSHSTPSGRMAPHNKATERDPSPAPKITVTPHAKDRQKDTPRKGRAS